MKNTKIHLALITFSLIGLMLFSCDNLPNSNATTSEATTTDSIDIADSTSSTGNTTTAVQEADTPTLILDEFGIFDDDDPIIYFNASVSEAKHNDRKFIYADGPDSLAFIAVDGKRITLKTLEWDSIDNGDDDYRAWTFSLNEEYSTHIVKKLASEVVESSAEWTGHITVTRLADGAVYKSAIYATSGH